jgi:hypothetical protein
LIQISFLKKLTLFPPPSAFSGIRGEQGRVGRFAKKPSDLIQIS